VDVITAWLTFSSQFPNHRIKSLFVKEHSDSFIESSCCEETPVVVCSKERFGDKKCESAWVRKCCFTLFQYEVYAHSGLFRRKNQSLYSGSMPRMWKHCLSDIAVAWQRNVRDLSCSPPNTCKKENMTTVSEMKYYKNSQIPCKIHKIRWTSHIGCTCSHKVVKEEDPYNSWRWALSQLL
jgi:hypothetical protein